VSGSCLCYDEMGGFKGKGVGDLLNGAGCEGGAFQRGQKKKEKTRINPKAIKVQDMREVTYVAGQRK